MRGAGRRGFRGASGRADAHLIRAHRRRSGARRAGRPAILAASPIKQYCQVLGYVAPQNKFELRLPLPAQWNQKFHLTPCAGFCGAVNGNACNPRWREAMRR